MATEQVPALIVTGEIPLSHESLAFPRVSRAEAPTLITFDVARTITRSQSEILELSPIGWDPYPDEGVPAFEERYARAFPGETLVGTFTNNTDNVSIRLGGTSFTTIVHLGLMNQNITEVGCYAPVGFSTNGGNDLTSVVNRSFRQHAEVIPKLKLNPTLHPNQLTPVIMSFILDGERSMVLLEGCKHNGISTPDVNPEQGSVLVVDSYELFRPDSTYAEAVRGVLDQRPDTLVTIGLGSTRIVEAAVPQIKRISEKATHLGISGNQGEVSLLMQTLGVTNQRGLFEQLGLKFLVETNGQEGAQLFVRHLGQVYRYEYRLSDGEINYGDNTNAGDVFLAGVLNGLINLPDDPDCILDHLQSVLPVASAYTFNFLRNRK